MTGLEVLALMQARGVTRSWNQAGAGEWADVLATFPLFVGISKRRLRKLARHATLAEFAPGETIFVAGDPTDTLYVILGGRAKTLGSPVDLKLATGDYFGEVALIDGRSRSATVIATSDVHAMRLPARSVLRLAHRDPTLALTLLRELMTRIRHLEVAPFRDRCHNGTTLDHPPLHLEQRLWRNR